MSSNLISRRRYVTVRSRVEVVADAPLPSAGSVLASSAAAEVARVMLTRVGGDDRETFGAMLLDARHRMAAWHTVSVGILTASLVHPREVFGMAIREGAAGIVLCHNHPSGDPEPSPEDLEITRRLCAVGELVGIRVFDHIVVAAGTTTYVSFLERGLL